MEVNRKDMELYTKLKSATLPEAIQLLLDSNKVNSKEEAVAMYKWHAARSFPGDMLYGRTL